MFNLFEFKIKKYFETLIYRFKKSKVKAVHDDDLPLLLESLGILEKVQKGEVNCVYCGNTVNLDNLEAIFLKNKEIKFVCSKPICISKL